jgi:hypothetical protein
MLLGAEVSPRLEQTGPVAWGSPIRVQHLRAAAAERVEYDYVSPDLARVLKDLQRTSKKDAKLRSPALLRALSRNWDRLYHKRQTVPSRHVARVRTYSRGAVAAGWLNELRETAWVAVGRGERVVPAAAVIKSVETQTLYREFAVGLEARDVGDAIATALHLITDVRVADLVDYIAKVRDGHERADEVRLHQIYRTIAKRCPPTAAWNTPVGGLTAQELGASLKVTVSFMSGPVSGGGLNRFGAVGIFFMTGSVSFRADRHSPICGWCSACGSPVSTTVSTFAERLPHGITRSMPPRRRWTCIAIWSRCYRPRSASTAIG